MTFLELGNAPTLKLTEVASGPFIAVAVDLDAPFPSLPFASLIVHWIRSELNIAEAKTLESKISDILNWLQPIPPPLSSAHRYLVILYQQPTDFDTPKWRSDWKQPVKVLSRTRWNLDDFVEQAGLNTMIAATYFRNG